MKKSFQWCFGITFGIIGVWFLAYALFVYTPNQIWVKNAAIKACADDLPDNYFVDKKDWWGNKIRITRKVNDENTVITHTATSAGRDGIFDTKDDYTYTRHDRMILKMTGYEVAKGIKQFGKGFWRGLFSKD